MRFARGASYDMLDGKVALLEVPDPDLGFAYQVKRVVREGGRWLLRSDNPARASFEAAQGTVPVAVLVDVISNQARSP